MSVGASKLRAITERNDVFQVLCALKGNRRKRAELGEVFVEGIEAIKQALASSSARPEKLLFRDRGGLSDWAGGLVDRGVFAESIAMDAALYEELADREEPSEVMATFVCPRLSLGDIELPERPFIVIFDRPSDQGNLGSLIRSANAFGVDLFITHGHCVDLYEPKVIRSSLGAIFRTKALHVESFQELSLFLDGLKRSRGLVVAGTDSLAPLELGSRELEKAGFGRPIALVLGNEAKGMSVRLKEKVDMAVRIPMVGEVNSLNVACAGTVLMWAASKNM
jgi:23S rRNA (uridine2479-2'-O)-methyltransferase